MNTLKEFQRIMKEQTEIALATSVENLPNVRIVNYYFNPENNLLYFASFKTNKKLKEIKTNAKVAFTTIPHVGNEHVKAQGTASKSQQTIFNLAECFISKIPDYEETIKYAGKSLILYEVAFEQALVTLDLSNKATLNLQKI